MEILFLLFLLILALGGVWLVLTVGLGPVLLILVGLFVLVGVFLPLKKILAAPLSKMHPAERWWVLWLTIIFVSMILVLCVGVLLQNKANAQLFAPPNTTIVPKTPLTVKPEEQPCTKYCILPPAEFDRPFAGTLKIEIVAARNDLKEHCGLAFKPGITLGCTRRLGDICRIVLVQEKIIKEQGWTKELMLRHEIGHCNGWPGDHPGQRRFDADDTEARRNPVQPVWRVYPQ